MEGSVIDVLLDDTYATFMIIMTCVEYHCLYRYRRCRQLPCWKDDGAPTPLPREPRHCLSAQHSAVTGAVPEIPPITLAEGIPIVPSLTQMRRGLLAGKENGLGYSIRSLLASTHHSRRPHLVRPEGNSSHFYIQNSFTFDQLSSSSCVVYATD